MFRKKQAAPARQSPLAQACVYKVRQADCKRQRFEGKWAADEGELAFRASAPRLQARLQRKIPCCALPCWDFSCKVGRRGPQRLPAPLAARQAALQARAQVQCVAGHPWHSGSAAHGPAARRSLSLLPARHSLPMSPAQQLARPAAPVPTERLARRASRPAPPESGSAQGSGSKLLAPAG